MLNISRLLPGSKLSICEWEVKGEINLSNFQNSKIFLIFQNFKILKFMEQVIVRGQRSSWLKDITLASRSKVGR